MHGIGSLGSTVAATVAALTLAAFGPAGPGAQGGGAGGPAIGLPAPQPDVVRACAAPPSPQFAQCLALVRTNVAAHRGASPDVTPAGYSPASLRSAYDLAAAAASSGQGRTVAVVDAFDDPNAESDLATYRSQYGLPSCTTGNGCFAKVNQDGLASPLPAASGSTGWATEESLDLDMVSAICPNCHILLVEADSTMISDLGTGEDAAVANGARYISNSYSGPDASGDSAFEKYFDHPGSAITASAGDDGFGVGYPAASRFVTAVGGTELTIDKAVARGWTERVWSGTGSGCSAFESRPSWQTGSGCTHRAVADVAADADPDTGVAMYDTYDQAGWLVVGGTSASSPIIAATYALAGLPATGDIPAWYLYRHASQLYDVTAGSNGSCSPAYLCHGEPGYDGPTGLGTPHGPGAFRAASHTVTVKSPGTRASVKGTTIKSLKITATDQDPVQKLTYHATSLPAGLTLSSSGVVTGTPTKLSRSQVTVRATDETGTSGSVTFTWRVDSRGTIRSGLSTTRCITDRSGLVEIVRCGATPLRWLIVPQADGTYTIALASATGTCMTVPGARTASGTKVVTGKCVGSTSQEWKIGANGHLVDKHAGKCLADPAGRPNGTQLIIAACRDAASQHWDLP